MTLIPAQTKTTLTGQQSQLEPSALRTGQPSPRMLPPALAGRMHANTNFIAAHSKAPEAIGNHLARVIDLQMAEHLATAADRTSDLTSVLLTSYFKRIPRVE